MTSENSHSDREAYLAERSHEVCEMNRDELTSLEALKQDPEET